MERPVSADDLWMSQGHSGRVEEVGVVGDREATCKVEDRTRTENEGGVGEGTYPRHQQDWSGQNADVVEDGGRDMAGSMDKEASCAGLVPGRVEEGRDTCRVVRNPQEAD